jgi:ankyrin repeat protein
MARDPITSPVDVRPLPARPSLEHLKNEAKERLKALRAAVPDTKLATAQLAVARQYGFASWRKLKAHIDEHAVGKEQRLVFDAARAGDFEAVRRAFERGFDPAALDDDGRTIHQIAKVAGDSAIESLAVQYQERATRPPAERAAVDAILAAAEGGHVEKLKQLLDAHPDLIDARGGSFQQQTALHKAAWHNHAACVRLLLDRGADVRVRDYGDNAYALHFAAEAADFAVVEMLVDAGSDTIGQGDDHGLEVIGWATCFRAVRRDVADYLLRHGARLNLWAAVALGRVDEVRAFIASDPSLLRARMSRNEHHRTPLHHAAALKQGEVARLLIDLGADLEATDDTGATPLATAAQEDAADVVALLQRAGARIGFMAALNLGRFDLAEAMLRDDPARIGPEGRDTIALHLSVAKRNMSAARCLIDHGVDVNARRVVWDCNQTALHMTAESGAVEMARLLLDAGADPNIADGKYDSSALGWAEFCGQEALAQLLREREGRS